MNLMDKKLMLIEYLSRVFYEISQMQHYREKKLSESEQFYENNCYSFGLEFSGV